MENDKNKKLTPEQEIEAKIRADLEQKQRDKAKGQINQAQRIAGLFAFILIFLVAFELFFEGSFFGLIFSRADYRLFWDMMRSNHFFDDWLQWGNWLAVTIFTGIIVGLAVAVAYLISYNVRDLVIFIKQFFGIGGVVVREVGTGLKEGLNEVDYRKKKDGPKSLFDDEPLEAKPIEIVAKPKKKRGPKPKSEKAAIIAKIDAELAKEAEEARSKNLREMVDEAPVIVEANIVEEPQRIQLVPAISKEELAKIEEEKALNAMLTSAPRVDTTTPSQKQSDDTVEKMKSLFTNKK